MLTSVRIGDVQVYNVDAVVSPAPMPYVLLGNSFLDRFQMQRENDVMTLDLRDERAVEPPVDLLPPRRQG